MCVALLPVTEDPAPVPAATGEHPGQQDPHVPHTTAHRQLQPTQPSCKSSASPAKLRHPASLPGTSSLCLSGKSMNFLQPSPEPLPC